MQDQANNTQAIQESSSTPSDTPKDVSGNLPGDIPGGVIKTRRAKQPVQLDLAIQIDRTGSSSAFAKGIQTFTDVLFTALNNKVASLNVILGSHGDLEFDEPFVLHLDGGDADQAREEISRLKFDGGGDWPETHLDGIAEMSRCAPWSPLPYARKAMVGIINAETKPTRCGLSAHDLGQQLKEAGVLFYLVCEPTQTLGQLVQAANGLTMPISNEPDRDEIQRAASLIGKSISASISAGTTIPLPPTSENEVGI